MWWQGGPLISTHLLEILQITLRLVPVIPPYSKVPAHFYFNQIFSSCWFSLQLAQICLKNDVGGVFKLHSPQYWQIYTLRENITDKLFFFFLPYWLCTKRFFEPASLKSSPKVQSKQLCRWGMIIKYCKGKSTLHQWKGMGALVWMWLL